MYKKISMNDKEIEHAINNEVDRQNEHIELIASENYVSEDVLTAVGSVLTNKYGEGYPGKGTMAAAKMLMLSKHLLLKDLKNFLELSLPMFNHIQDQLPMLQL